jgi:hypothetical protein
MSFEQMCVMQKALAVKFANDVDALDSEYALKRVELQSQLDSACKIVFEARMATIYEVA